MSTKIYDAYRLKSSKNSLDYLTEIMTKLKESTEEKARQDITEILGRKIQHGKDMFTFYGWDILDPEKTFITDKWELKLIKSCAEAIGDPKNEHNTARLFFNAHDSFERSMKERPKEFTPIDYTKLLLIPCGKRTLAMTFGNTHYIDMNVFEQYFEDYHYQNQCDRPEHITSREWSKRKNDWNKAIGPDYIPAHHGFEVKLFDLYDYTFSAKIQGIGYQDSRQDQQKALKLAETNYKYRVRSIVDTIEYPEMPKNANYTKVLEVMETDAYKTWIKKQIDIVSEKLGITKEQLDS